MAYPILSKGRMPTEDEDRLQRCTELIEKDVEAKDITPILYTAKTLDFNDRSEIDGMDTRVGRVRLLLKTLVMRGPYAFREFVKALKEDGYHHVVEALETRPCLTDYERDKLAETGNHADDATTSVLHSLERLDILISDLCERVKVLESYHYDTPLDNQIEFEQLKDDLSELKEDTVKQVRKLTAETLYKETQIVELTATLREKEEKLEDAEERIRQLEERILDLEARGRKYRTEIDKLTTEGRQHADKLFRHERKMNVQEKKLKQQEEEIVRMKLGRIKEDNLMSEMNLRMANMEIMLSTRQPDEAKPNSIKDTRFRVIGRNMHQGKRGNKVAKWT